MKNTIAARLSLIAVLLGTTALGLPPAQAAADNWVGTTSSDWQVLSNWSGGVPGAGTTTVIDVALPNPTILSGGTATTGDLTVSAGGSGELTIEGGGQLTSSSIGIGQVGPGAVGAITVTGAGSQLNTSLGSEIGSEGTGYLNVLAGAAVNAGDTIIGTESTGFGAVVVDAATFTSTGLVDVGDHGTGTVAIRNGGVATPASMSLGAVAGAKGTVTVTGAGSSLTVTEPTNQDSFIIGDAGSGTLNILGGGTVTSNSVGIAEQAGSTGYVDLDGVGSAWDTGNFYLASAGTATIDMLNGAALSVGGNLNVGQLSGSDGIMHIDGSGTKVTVGNDLNIGDSGTGRVNLTEGATVTAYAVTVGVDAGGSGTLSVRDSGSLFQTTHALRIGDSGTGGMTISLGGAVTDQIGIIGDRAGSNGRVFVTDAGSSWSGTDLTVGSAGAGLLAVSRDGVVNVTNAIVVAEQAGSVGKLYIGASAGGPIGAGTINAPGIAFGAGAGELDFNHDSSNYVFAVPITGFGTINQLAGTTSLTGNSSGFFGNVNITGGALAVNGDLSGGLVYVNSGATLGGNGTVGGFIAETGSIIAPGNSIGTLHAALNVMFGAGSFYQVQLDGAGNADLVTVAGSATLNGGTVQALVGKGAFKMSTDYTILHADAGVNGTFSGVTSDAAFLTPSLSYDADNVYLTMTRNVATFASIGETPNQKAAGAATDALGNGNTVFDAAVQLNAAAARAAFDALSGEEHASLRSGLVEDSSFLRQAAIDRLRAAFGGVGAAPVGPVFLSGGPDAIPAEAPFAVWGKAFGGWGSDDGDGNAAAFKHNSQGVFFGADALFANDFRAGLIAGYSHSSFDVDARSSSGSSEDFHLGLYGGGQWGPIGLRSGLAYTWHRIDTTRTVAFPGFGETEKAAYDAGTLQAFAEAGYRLDLTPNAALEPFAGLALVNLHTDAFTETGGAAALSGAARDSNTVFSTLGLHGSYAFDLNGMPVSVRGTLGWRHAFGDVTSLASLAFAGGDSFTVAGVPIARDAALIEAGVDVALAPNARLSLAYDGQIAAHARQNGLKSDLTWKF